MNYAPVIIPTLNRYDHFKKCIESLNECNLANETDVFVALDYPPSEKYVEGYNIIKNYLESTVFNFKSFHIKKREKNYGIGVNADRMLTEDVLPYYDRFIFSEDDNVFAKTFLQYMDYGLDVCTRRDDIVGVGAYSLPVKWKNDGNDLVLLNSNANAWGYGLLREQYYEFKKIDVVNYYHEILSSKSRRRNVLSGSNNDCGAMAWFVMTGNGSDNDTFKSIYLRDKKKYYLVPKLSKAINEGTDGSGQSSGKVDYYGYSKAKLDSSDYIDKGTFDNIPEYYGQETMDLVNSFYHLPGWKMLWIKVVFKTHNFWKHNTWLGKFIRNTYVKLNPRL